MAVGYRRSTVLQCPGRPSCPSCPSEELSWANERDTLRRRVSETRHPSNAGHIRQLGHWRAITAGTRRSLQATRSFAELPYRIITRGQRTVQADSAGSIPVTRSWGLRRVHGKHLHLGGRALLIRPLCGDCALLRPVTVLLRLVALALRSGAATSPGLCQAGLVGLFWVRLSGVCGAVQVGYSGWVQG